VGGGNNNNAQGDNASIAGGGHNRAGIASFVGGGESNWADGLFATIAGGSANYVSGTSGSIGGGDGNSASAHCAVVPGGRSNAASGRFSFAAGRRAKAITAGAFVWADSIDQDFSSNFTNEFLIRATGGVRLYTNSGLTAGVRLSAGSSLWSAVSDSSLKTNIRLVDGTDILDRVMQVPIKRWNYKAQDSSIEHIGPMAQDFHRVFGIGEDSVTISMLDPSGVALGAIQELNRRNCELTARLSEVTARVEELERIIREISIASGRSTDFSEGRPAEER